jgi:hypothetical protein
VKSVVRGPDLTTSSEVEESDLVNMSSGRRSRRDTRKNRRRREKHGSKYNRERQRSRSSLRSRTPVRSYTRGEDEDVRMRNLEEIAAQGEMLAQLVQQGSPGSESRPTVVRVSVKSDCIPEFIPGQPNQTSAKLVDKIDQLARVIR